MRDSLDKGRRNTHRQHRNNSLFMLDGCIYLSHPHRSRNQRLESSTLPLCQDKLDRPQSCILSAIADEAANMYLRISSIASLIIIALQSISPVYAATVKDFLEAMDGENALDRTTMNSYWRGVLDTTMYTMTHEHIRFDIKDAALVDGKLCAPKNKYPTPEQFLIYYDQYIDAEIKVKGKETVEQMGMDQIMFRLWFALFNCKNPVWNGYKTEYKPQH